MRRLVFVACTAVALAAFPATAQRGMGDAEGVARWDEVPPMQSVSGRVADVHVEACAQTTGWASSGAHVFLETPDGRTLNVHLGPYDVLADLVDDLTEGADVEALAFRTDAMPPEHLVAVELTVDGETFTLRDPDDLQPLWATGPRAGQRVEDMPPEAMERRRHRGQEPRVTDRCWWQPQRRGAP